jgi:hypothetical protein
MSDHSSSTAFTSHGSPLARVAARPGSDRCGILVYWILACVPVAVVLAVPALALTDGGMHLESAEAFDGLIAGRWTGLVHWTGTLPPNLLVELVLGFLVRIMDPEWALRLVACALLLGFAAAAAALVKALRAPTIAAILFLPFQANYLFEAAQLGFDAGVALGLALVVLVLRHPAGIPRLKFALLLSATWLAHIFPALLAMVGVVAIVFARSLHYSSGAPSWQRIRRAVGAVVRQLAVPCLPAIALTVAWVATAPVFVHAVGNVPGQLPLSFARTIMKVIGMTWSTVAYSRVELAVYYALALMLYMIAGAILLYRLRRERRAVGGIRASDGLLAASMVIACVAIVIPDSSTNGAALLAVRTSLFVPLFLVGWVVANMDVIQRALAGRGRSLACTALIAPLAVAVAVVLVVTAVRYQVQVALGREVDDVRPLEHCIPEGSTMIQLDLAYAAVSALHHDMLDLQTGLMAADKHLLALDNESGWYPYYLWGFTDRDRADRLLTTSPRGIGQVPPNVNLAPAVKAGLPLDAVVLYGRREATPATLADPRAVRLQRDLSSEFHRAAVSNSGDWELWLRRGLTGACGLVRIQ